MQIKRVYAHLQVICNVSAQYGKGKKIKAIRAVAFTMYALLTLIEYVQRWENV